MVATRRLTYSDTPMTPRASSSTRGPRVRTTHVREHNTTEESANAVNAPPEQQVDSARDAVMMTNLLQQAYRVIPGGLVLKIGATVRSSSRTACFISWAWAKTTTLVVVSCMMVTLTLNRRYSLTLPTQQPLITMNLGYRLVNTQSFLLFGDGSGCCTVYCPLLLNLGSSMQYSYTIRAAGMSVLYNFVCLRSRVHLTAELLGRLFVSKI